MAKIDFNSWIESELYPSLYRHIPEALPELHFRERTGRWVSSYKLTLEERPGKDKTYISERAPYCICENGGDNVSIINYVAERDNITKAEAIKQLAKIAGVSLPERDGSFNEEEYSARMRKKSLLEDAAGYFSYCLKEGSKSADAQAYRDYLINARGYSMELIDIMGLGYIPSYDKLCTYLTKRKGYTDEEVEDGLHLSSDYKIGESHRLVIPFRVGSSIIGFKFRTISTEFEGSGKYRNTKGMQKNGLFNISPLKGDKDLVIVEGELDCLAASARGIANVVAIAGSNLSEAQVVDALAKGAKSFTICLDNEKPKASGESPAKKILAIIKTIQSQGVGKIYVATLPRPEGVDKVDPDSYIRDNGIEAFKEVLTTQVQPYYYYQLGIAIERYSATKMGAKDTDAFKEEVVTIVSAISTPTDRNSFINKLASRPDYIALGLDKDGLEAELEKLLVNKEKAAKTEKLRELGTKLPELLKGSPEDAIADIETKLAEVKEIGAAEKYSTLFETLSEEELKAKYTKAPTGISSGLSIGKFLIELPAGALTIPVAPTSHGKTTLLLSMAMNVVREYPGKKVYFLSYEESDAKILTKMLTNYIAEPISENVERSIGNYLKTGSIDYIKQEKRDVFMAKKAEFFTELVATKRLNVVYVDWDSSTLVGAIKALHKQGDAAAVFIDYMQMITLPGTSAKGLSRQEQLKQIGIALKNVAVETGLPIVVAAQFNREVVNPLRMHPTKIGEAGDIERIANLILGMWNYNQPMIIDGKEAEEFVCKDQPGSVYMKVLKNRDGEVGADGTLKFDGNQKTISTMANTLQGFPTSL